MALMVVPTPVTVLGLLLAPVLLVLLWRQSAHLPRATRQAIKAHFAREGRVKRISPALMGFARPPRGARHYDVKLVTPGGLKRGHIIEVDAAGRVRTMH